MYDLPIAIVLVAGIAFFYLRYVLHNRQQRMYDFDIFRVSIPKYADVNEKRDYNYKERLSQIENLFAALASMKAQSGLSAYFRGRTDHFALEMVMQNGTIYFYAVMPKGITDFFVQQVQSVYSHAHFERVADYNIFQPQSAVLGGYLVFRRSFIFPIRTYKSFDSDPMESLTTALSKLPKENGAAIQFVLRSANKSWHRHGRTVTQQAYKMGSLAQALKQETAGGALHAILRMVHSLFSILGASFEKTKQDQSIEKQRQLSPSPKEQEALKGIEEKNSKGGFDVNVRIVVSAQDQQHAEMYLRNIMTSFGQYNVYEMGNAFKPLYTGRQERIIQNFIYRYYDDRARMVLNAEEFVGLFHLPEHLQTPSIAWLKAKDAAPPIDMPLEGIGLGISNYRDQDIEVRIKDADRRRHVYIVGQTGTGKTQLLQHMAIQDIQRGKGVCVIDPHGDLVDNILSNIPRERADDVIVFDPSDTDRPLALNMLEFFSPDQKTFVINEMINIFDKLYDLRTTGGPMFEQYMRNAMLLMMEDPESGSTLLEVPKIMADEKFRRMKLAKTQNPVVRDFWEKEAQKAGGEASLANMVPYITSKLTQFIANDIMRPIIAQQKSSFNFRSVMDEQKILLINLSKGKIGDMNSALLGMVCVGKLLMAALSRVDMREDERKDFYLYIDEFQNAVTDSIAIILSEARKYKLNLTMANQYLSQLVKNNNSTVKDAVFGNVGTIIAFRVGVDDAETIAQQFAPVVDKYDVMNIEKYQCYIRLLIDNQNPPAFNMRPPYIKFGDQKMVHAIKEMSRLKYGRPRDVVEREIVERTRIAIPTPSPLPPIA